MSDKFHKLTLRCEAGHEQTISINDKAMDENMVHDFGVLLAGGTLRSIGREMPGHPCNWKTDEDEQPCGAKVSFSTELSNG